MTETRTCARCGRNGTQQFVRIPNLETGGIEWRCHGYDACRDRQLRNEREAASPRTDAAETIEPHRGRCPVCDRDVQLKKDGTLYHHGGPIGSGRPGWHRAYRCEGVGKPPISNRDNESEN